MTFWIIVAVLAATVTYFVTRPLSRAAGDIADASSADVEVYKDQLAEIDADLGRGALSQTEADAAKAEVARRLLRAAPAGEAGKADAAVKPASLAGIHTLATLAMPLVALLIYLSHGSPDQPDEPLKQRLATAPQNATASDLIAKVEERLREEPNDGKGWDVIAPVYASQGRFDDAAEAFQNAIRLLGESAKRMEGLALAQIRGANGLVGEPARKALQRAVELDPKRLEPRIWLGLAKEQEGDLPGAIAAYKALLAETPASVPWRVAVADRLAGVEARANGTAPPQPAAAGDASASAPAASGQAESSVAGLPAEQRAMIDKMVAGLATRLKENGNDLEGWLKLMRALKVLGRTEEAVAAFGDAKKQFSSDANALAEIDGLAKSLGIGS